MKFTLRRWQKSDLEQLVLVANNFNIAKNLTDQFPFPYTLEKGKFFINNVSQYSPTRVFAIDIDGKAIGAIGIHPQEGIQEKNAELGYWLAEEYWGRGIITQAIQEMVQYGFKHFNITRIFARPFGTNIGSQKALEKAGFILEARFEKTFFKNNEFVDELIYALRNTSNGE